MKIGLLLEGGGMRGLYTAGIIDVFMQNNIIFDGIIGVSAGALFGMNIKSKQIGRVLRYNLKYANNKNYMGFYSLFKTGDIMNKDFCFNKLVNELDPIDFDTFRSSNENFWAVVTNVQTGKPEYIKIDDLKKEEQIEYLRASGSMPLVSRFVEVNGNKYLDGGIADSIPIEKIMEMNYDKVIVVLTRPKEYRKQKSNNLLTKIYYREYPNLVKTIEERYWKYNAELDIIKKLESENKIFVLRPSRKVNIKRVEKNCDKIQEMYDLGKEDAINHLDELGRYLEKL